MRTLGSPAFQHEWVPWEKKKENGKKTQNRLYFKNNRKAISCDNLLTLDQVYTGKRLKCNRFSGVRVLSSNS